MVDMNIFLDQCTWNVHHFPRKIAIISRYLEIIAIFRSLVPRLPVQRQGTGKKRSVVTLRRDEHFFLGVTLYLGRAAIFRGGLAFSCFLPLMSVNCHRFYFSILPANTESNLVLVAIIFLEEIFSQVR